MTAPRLLLVRHGEITWSGRMGAPDDGLNDRGRRQAAAVASRLAELRPTALYSSTLPRAMQTAEIISERTGLPVRPDPRLREWSVGEWEGLAEEDVKAGQPGAWERLQSDWRFAPPGGETVTQFRDRALSAVADVLAGGAGWPVALITHGGWLHNYVWHLLDVDPDGLVAWENFRGQQPFVFDNCGLTIVEARAGRHVLLTLNDTSHLAGL